LTFAVLGLRARERAEAGEPDVARGLPTHFSILLAFVAGCCLPGFLQHAFLRDSFRCAEFDSRGARIEQSY
jgi:hypothetical protein